jgi:nicotinate-nucleotide adenylyltransferase
MSTLCFGGSFNPIHFGHLRCAKSVAAERGFDHVMLIPSGHPPHKNRDLQLASAEDRLQMCRLAVEYDPLFTVDDLEIRRATTGTIPSYTIDTARQLRQRGWKEINWLIGADMLNDLPNWHQPAALLQEVNFIVMARPGYEFDWAKLPPEFQVLRSNLIPAPQIDISATDIRRRISAGQSIHNLLPNAVENYIRQNRLYGITG